MFALSAQAAAPTRASVNAVFGGPLDIWRLLLPGMLSGPVVCVACQTLNRRSSGKCKACDGKLPAYYAGRERIAQPTTRLVVPRQWMTVAWAGAAVVLMFAAFALWFVHQARPVAPRIAAVAPAPQAPAPLSALQVRPLDMAPIQVALVRADLEPQPAAPKRVATRPPAHPDAGRVRQQAAGDPLAHCQSRGFFARAACENQRCAQRALAGHPRCTPVVAQQRLDESRRNPVMLN